MIMEWIPIKFDDDGNFDCHMPDDGQTVLVCFGNTVTTDEYNEDEEGGYFEFFDAGNLDAWMPLPKPYWG